MSGAISGFISGGMTSNACFVAGTAILTTPEHPFYAPCKGWTEAVLLRAGNILVLQSGKYVIVEKVQYEILEAPIPVYNFEVEDFHTYYVGDNAILVHNMCFDPKTNSSRIAVLKNGSRAYLQDAGEHAGRYIAKDTARHANSAYKIFKKIRK